jgi:hypothetical protein
MYLIQILLPLYDNEGRHFSQETYRKLRTELAERFGGLTAFTRAPAEGLWTEGGETSHDEIVIFEVMAEDLDRNWWRAYRRELEGRFRQDAIVIRVQATEQI